MRLKDKVAVVTGVDAGGIGQATATQFAEEGAKVLVAGRVEEAGIETVSYIKKQGGEAFFLKVDVAKEDDVKWACEETVRTFGKLDILVNSEAVFVPRGLDAPVEDWQYSLNVNVIGSAFMSRYAAEAMKRQKKGAIVNVVSTYGLVARPQSTTYSATQGALLQMTRAMAAYLAAYNLRVNCVCHGTVLTPALSEQTRRMGDMLEGESRKNLLNRVGQPREVARAILFLASDEASFITGTHLVVDGGYSATVSWVA